MKAKWTPIIIEHHRDPTSKAVQLLHKVRHIFRNCEKEDMNITSLGVKGVIISQAKATSKRPIAVRKSVLPSSYIMILASPQIYRFCKFLEMCWQHSLARAFTYEYKEPSAKCGSVPKIHVVFGGRICTSEKRCDRFSYTTYNTYE